MENLLRKLGLKKIIRIKLRTSKEVFVKKLSENIDKKSLSLFSSTLEVFSFSKNNFKGKIENDTFELMKRRTFFNAVNSTVKSKGRFSEENNILNIEIEIDGAHPLTLSLFCLMFLVFILFWLHFELQFIPIIISVISLFIAFFLFVSLIVKRMNMLESDLRKEFNYILQKK